MLRATLAVLIGVGTLLVSPLSLSQNGATPLQPGPATALALGKTRVIFLPLVYRPSAPAAPTITELPTRSIEQRVLEQVNDIRMARGLPPLHLASELALAAARHSQDMADKNFLSHTSSDGSSPWDRFKKAGYSMAWGGEDIAVGAPNDPDRIMNAWMASDGHRENILGVNYAETGAGYAYNPATDGAYWTLDFGSRADVLPVIINGDKLIATSRNVNLYLYNDKGGGYRATQIMISNDPGFANAAWEPYVETHAWTLAAGSGWHTVYVKFLRTNGSIVQSSDDIFLKGS